MEELRSILGAWFAARHPSGVHFRETLQPPPDDSVRYEVCYEAAFVPTQLDQAYVDVCGTTEGEVCLGFEHHQRIAERLRVKAWQPLRVVAGYEACPLSQSGLVGVLNAVADGQLAVVATALPGLGLVSARAVAEPTVLAALAGSGNASLPWIGAARRRLWIGQRLLAFHPWN